MTTPNPRRARLAERLRALRAAKFRSGNQFAQHISWPQPRVSKLETGAQLPTEEDIHEWVRATDAGEDTAAELLELLASAQIEYVRNRDVVRRGGFAAAQTQLAALESQATRIAEYQPAMVPGIVQTAGYARERLARGDRLVTISDEAVEALIAERVRRQDILYQPGRRVQVVVGEAALRTTPGTVETLLGQLDRLVSVAGLSAVELGVIPFPYMPAVTVCGFVLHNDDLVLVETLTGEQQFHDPDEVTVYVKALDQLRAAALTGEDAVALIRDIATQLQRLGQ